MKLRPHAVQFLSLIVCCFGPHTIVYAVDYSWSPTARIGMRADNNVRGSGSREEAAWGFEQGGSVGLIARDELWQSSLRPHINLRRFAVGKNLDAEEYGVDLDNQYNSEFWGGGLDFRYARDSTLSSEATDLGIKNDVTDRDTVSISPNLSYVLNEETSARMDFSYTDTTFARGQQTGFIDYSYMQASLQVNRTLSERDSIFATPFVSNFESPQINSKTRTYGGQLGYRRIFSPTLEATATLGFASSTIDFLDQRPDLNRPVRVFDFATFQFRTIFPFAETFSNTAATDGMITSAHMVKKFESGKIALDYSRQVSPTARGSQEVSDAIIVSADRNLSSRWSVGAYGSYVMATAESDLRTQNLNRDQSFMQLACTYRLTEHISLQSAYSFAYRPGTDFSGSVGQHGISLYFLYDGGSRSFRGGY